MASINVGTHSILPTWLRATALTGLLLGAVELPSPSAAPVLPVSLPGARELLTSPVLRFERALMIEVSLPVLESR
ncbi:MAG TPA: hypothetical protein VFZ65_22620 [Planctomycetota bacterium]|nr:hypothetical protein [Planctomycetota bacterium]